MRWTPPKLKSTTKLALQNNNNNNNNNLPMCQHGKPYPKHDFWCSIANNGNERFELYNTHTHILRQQILIVRSNEGNKSTPMYTNGIKLKFVRVQTLTLRKRSFFLMKYKQITRKKQAFNNSRLNCTFHFRMETSVFI